MANGLRLRMVVIMVREVDGVVVHGDGNVHLYWNSKAKHMSYAQNLTESLASQSETRVLN